jgi:hypothetical protein
MYIENQLLDKSINVVYISPDHNVLPIFQNNNLNTIIIFLLYLIIFFI